MQIKQLEYLVKIVENGSISKAAEQLYITQPNLTKAVSSLEKEYGIRLFNRRARGVELTAEGKEFMRSLQTPKKMLRKCWPAERKRSLKK